MSAVASYFLDLVYSLTNCMVCFPGTPQLKINSRSFKILRLLGEGGFSYVYLVQDSTQQLYALKKIRCPFGQESVAHAMKEVEAYSLFAPHPNIIHSIDYSVASDKSDPGAKTVYIVLPYYRRGNLQDLINANLVNHTKFPERKLMVLFLGVCKALKAMHQYKVKEGPGGAQSLNNAKRVRREAAEADDDAEEMAMHTRRKKEDRNTEEVEAEPLMEGEVTISQEGHAPGQQRAYAHRDIKPGNIMIADDGRAPILMDLGSLAPSPTPITSRSLALAVQDEAGEHSTMPYRAPELFDVKTGSVVDTKVDIWSLGCTLYACLVGKSPFEARSEETGGSLSMCVLGGDWRFPDEGQQRGKQKASPEEEISTEVKEVVRRCLVVEPSERPDIDELIKVVEDVIETLPADGGDD
ncbi:serine/threonine protein kinase-like protein [Pseudovirgaria hyperparasitica]|uniref:non-specific serine/threonine protein kinase n=1 Tax=Pseudovirgaria hyperparasitica TaxID=470096 RepID=A0A6A6VWJ9_9PEZI|nr:serine/threonine protein kinase-like protein [Pseudovirgaria hyperparasitica]KAF2754229.1 serine/threonine protein kinase-like protein [Pseudovirgaria hyperparasitica]